MRDDEQVALATLIAATMAQFEARCERIEQRLQALAQQVPEQIEEQTGRWLQVASGKVESVARAGLEPPLAEGQRSVQRVATEADQTVKALQAARHDFVPIARRVWLGAGMSLVLSLVALIGTYLMLYGHYAIRYEALKSRVAYLDAIQASDVVPCGEGRLCARIDDKAQRLGDKKQYRLIELKP